MAFKRANESGNLQDLPMLSEYIEAMEPKELKKFNGSVHLVVGITIAKSGKGYMLNFHSFCTFIFKKSKEADTLREYIDDNTIGIPCIEIDSQSKYNFHFGIDDEIQSVCQWVTDSMGKVRQLEKELSKEHQSKEVF